MKAPKFKDRYVLASGYPCMRGAYGVVGQEYIGMVPRITDMASQVVTMKVPNAIFAPYGVPRYRLVLERVKKAKA